MREDVCMCVCVCVCVPIRRESNNLISGAYDSGRTGEGWAGTRVGAPQAVRYVTVLRCGWTSGGSAARAHRRRRGFLCHSVAETFTRGTLTHENAGHPPRQILQDPKPRSTKPEEDPCAHRHPPLPHALLVSCTVALARHVPAGTCKWRARIVQHTVPQSCLYTHANVYVHRYMTR